MSKYIGQLLQADQRSLDSIINRLEHMSLQPGVDTRLTAEIITLSREKVRQLGLDPKESTNEEMYYGLLAKSHSDDQVLRKKLGITDSNTVFKSTSIIAETAQKLVKKDIVVSIQPPALKLLLKSVPPKRTLKLLHFRSIDSVLKRENPLALYALAKRVEDKSWHTQVQARIKRLSSWDVKESQVQIISLPEEWLDKLQKQPFENLIFPVAETGCILLLPTESFEIEGSVLLALSVILQASMKLSVESLPHRTKALSISYERALPHIASGSIELLDPIHGLQPSWHAVYQLLAEQKYKQVGEFEFVLGDLEWQSTETKLASIASELDFWVNTHYLGFPGSETPISMHLVDVVANFVLKRPYGNHITTHLKSSLWNELQLRYLRQEAFEKSVLSQLTLTQEIVL
jgi:hypothetical protein